MKTDSAEAPPLVFAWWERRPDFLILLGFVMLSLFAHVATFFVFQVVYPQHVTIPPPAPQVSLLTPSTPESKALLDWVESENPALVAAMAQAPVKGLVELKYHPSFETQRTAPRTPPPLSEKTQFPPARSPLDLIRSVSPLAPAPARVFPPAPTRVTLSGGLASRPFTTPPSFEATSRAPLQIAQFLIGANDRGQILYTFLQRSSGDRATDLAAAAQLQKASLAPAEAAITWGFATIAWGEDAYLPESSSSVKPDKGGAP